MVSLNRDSETELGRILFCVKNLKMAKLMKIHSVPENNIQQDMET